jgi:uncharacterized delta-60 repeat protein
MNSRVLFSALRTPLLLFLAALAFSLNERPARAQNFDGRLDAGFQPPSELQVRLYLGRRAVVAVQPNGKILFGGEIDQEGEQVARLNADGSRDTSFHSPSYTPPSLDAIVVQPDGRFLLGGAGLVRMLPDGQDDPSFESPLSGPEPWWNNVPTRVVLQPDGKILVSGGFDHSETGAQPGLVRLLDNGSTDPTFQAASSDLPRTIEAIALQPDGKVLVAGYTFTEATNTWEGKFVRLLPNGVRDATFAPVLNRGVSAITLQSDGKILVAGYDWTGFYQRHGYVLRLEADGSPDATFAPGIGQFEILGYSNEGVMSMIVQPDGKILIGGTFYLVFRDWRYGSLLRLEPDGTRDFTFNPVVDLAGWADDASSVTSMALQPDGRLLIAGDISEVHGVPRRGIARLFTDGTLPQGAISFSADSFTLREGSPNQTITIERQGPNLGPITVQYALQDVPYGLFPDLSYLSGDLTEDFAGLTGSVSFAAGETSKTVSLPIVNDTRLEPTESFVVALTGTIGTAAFGDRIIALVHLQDDDSLGLPGSIDTNFSGNVAGSVSALVTQNDGRLLVGGNFFSFDGVPRANLLRLNLDGTLDPAFNPSAPEITSLAVQGDGRILIAGAAVQRLLATGAPDPAFQDYFVGHPVLALAVQSDGRILLGSISGVQRLDANGAPDFNFLPFSGVAADQRVDIVHAIIPQADGKILVGGQNAATQFPVLARLNPDGSRDDSFTAPTFDMGYMHGLPIGILAMAQQPDGKFLVGGGFGAAASNVPYHSLVRLETNGTIDPTFHPELNSNSSLNSILLQPDGRVLIAGNVILSNGNDVGLGFGRLFDDGRIDHSFRSGTGSIDHIKSIARQPNGAIWIGGNFTTYNGYHQPALARIHGDDQIGPGRIEFVLRYESVKENAGPIALKLRRIWGTTGTVTVHYATGGGDAIPGVHYTAASGTVSFANGETEKTIFINPIDDALPQLNRSFDVTLSAPTGGADLDQFPTNTVTIQENDLGILVRRIARDENNWTPTEDFSVSENVGTAFFHVYFVGDRPSTPVNLSYSTHDGTARAGQDYTTTAATTSFGGPYSTTQDIEIPILPDNVLEGSETFTVTLSTPTPGIALPLSEFTVTILEKAPIFRLFPHPAGPTVPGHFRMLMQIPKGTPFAVQASTNLVDWSVIQLFPAQALDGPLEFEDPDAVNFTKRFYRLAPGP